MFKNRYVLTKKMRWEWAFIAANHKGILFFLLGYAVFGNIFYAVSEYLDTINGVDTSRVNLIPACCLIIGVVFVFQFIKCIKMLSIRLFAPNTELTYCITLGALLTITLENTMESVSCDIESVKRCIQTRKYLLLLLADNKMTLLRRDAFVNCSEDEFFLRLFEGGSAVKRTSVGKIALWAVLLAMLATSVLLLEYLPQ